MHDGGLLGSKLLAFVPGTNFHVLQIISIIIIKRGMDNTLYTLYTPPYKYIYIYWNCLFLIPLFITTVIQDQMGWRYFFVEIAQI